MQIIVVDSVKTMVNDAWLERYAPTHVIKAVVGDDNFDFAACKARGVEIIQVDYGHDIPCAEWLVRELLSFECGRGSEVCNKTAVVVGGLGRIGKRVIRVLSVLGVRCLVFDVAVKGHDKARLRVMLEAADYCLVCCPLNEGSRGLIGDIELKALGNKGLLACVSRALVCDFPAVLRFLREGGRASFDADFTEIKDIVLEYGTVGTRLNYTQHVCGYTLEARERRANAVSQALARLKADWAAVV